MTDVLESRDAALSFFIPLELNPKLAVAAGWLGMGNWVPCLLACLLWLEHAKKLTYLGQGKGKTKKKEKVGQTSSQNLSTFGFKRPS